jgi:TonB family protein
MFIAFLLAAATTVPEATPIEPASWFSPNDYPTDALKKGIQGSVSFDVEVDPEGRPTGCRVTVSSGDPNLDQTTCKLVESKGKFIPATGPDGKPVAGHYSSRANWFLQPQTTTGPVPGDWPIVAPKGVKVTPDWSDSRLYPMDARKKNEEGSLRAQLLVGSDGKPMDCRIVESSKFADLDTGTCQLMLQMRFDPAVDSHGIPIPSTYSRDVVWLLVDPRPFASSTLKVRASISNGRQTSCEVVGGEGPYVVPWSALVCPFLRDLPYYFGAHAFRSARVSVEFRLDAGDGAVILNQPWGAAPVIASEKLSFVVDGDGDPSECTPVEKYGFGPQSPIQTSPCPSLLGLLWFDPPEPQTSQQSEEPVRRKGIFETRVYLVGEDSINAVDPAKLEISTCQGELGGANPVTAKAKIKACTDLLGSGQLSVREQANMLVNRAMAYAAQKSEDLAAVDLDASTKVDPTYAYAWALSCSFHTANQKDLPRAARECSKAIELAPTDPNGWTFRGDIFFSSHDFQKAIPDYDQAIKLDSTWMWPFVNRGEAYLRSGNIDRAIQDFEIVMKLAPDYAMGHLDRGTARVRKNQLDAALSDFEAGLKIDPKCASCLYGRGIVKGRKGDKAGEAADIQAAKLIEPKVSQDFDEDGVFPD